jgi:hypothetical protein
MGDLTDKKPFKGNEWEWIFFILMNLSAPPAALLVCGIIWGLAGAIGSVVAFIVLFQVWKRVGGHRDGKLIFSPGFSWAGKTYRMR